MGDQDKTEDPHIDTLPTALVEGDVLLTEPQAVQAETTLGFHESGKTPLKSQVVVGGGGVPLCSGTTRSDKLKLPVERKRRDIISPIKVCK